jgi:gliding motility-associated-like protein
MRMKKIILLFSLCIVSIQYSFAQLEADNWMFSYDYWVRFNKATTPDTVRYPGFSSSFLIGSGTTSYSDKNGTLQFYAGSRGVIYDRNFQPFPSTNIVGGIPLYNLNGLSGVSQPVLAVPYPENDSLFILFHMRNEYSANAYFNTLYYSVINMKLRNGLGEVVAGQRNIPLLGGSEVGYKLTAILHCNKKDIWVIGHLTGSDKYFSLLVTASGVSSTPVYFTGAFIPKRRTFDNYVYDNANNNGCIKVSAQGNRLAAAFKGMGFIELFDFNTQTGIASNLRTLSTDPPPADTIMYHYSPDFCGPVGIEFSPSGDKLYTTSNYHLRRQANSTYAAYIQQFDVSLGNQTAIQASKYRLDSLNGFTSGAIQIANNGKMYINISDHLFEVADPENSGALCNYNGLTVFSGVQYANLNLPTYVQSFFRYPIIATGNCQFQNISFSIQQLSGVSSILWDFGDPASGINNFSTSFTPTHIFTAEAAYEVKAILYNSNGCGADTIRKLVYTGPFKVFLGNDTTICKGDTLRLRMNIPNANNFWSNGTSDTVLTITGPGKYWVRTSIGECVASDTITIFERDLPRFSLGTDKTICVGETTSLFPSPDPSNVSYNWSTGAANNSININTDGLYWLELTDNTIGCKYTDSINVQFKALPNFNLGSDTLICEKDTLVLNAAVTGADSYTWNTGAVQSTLKAYQNGIYWVDVSKDNCIFRDSILINIKPLPVVRLGNDTTLCENQTLQLDAGNAGSTYLWQNNSQTQTFIISQQGTYNVRVTTNGCSASDTIIINYLTKPLFSLGPDKTICPGEEIMLSLGFSNVNYTWQNGSISSSYLVNSTGLYYVDISNNCGTSRDSILFSNGICDLYIPSAFTPNNDGKNDIFKALGKPLLTNFKLQVYNRWGELVFETDDYSKGWDGKHKGSSSPSGVYVWVVNYKKESNDKSEVIKGTVTLLR